MKSPAHRDVQIDALRDAGNVHRADAIAVEEPLEIRLVKDRSTENGGTGRPISITMRTPGNDADLAVGFLYGEGLLRESRDVVDVRPCGPTGNVIRVTVRADLPLDLDRLNRNFYTTSSCGVCGKASIAAVTASAGIRAITSDLVVRESVLRVMPDKTIMVNSTTLTFEELPDRLKRMFAARDDHVLFVDIDDELPYAFAVDVLDQARAGGAVTIAALTKPLSSPAPAQ